MTRKLIMLRHGQTEYNASAWRIPPSLSWLSTRPCLRPEALYSVLPRRSMMR